MDGAQLSRRRGSAGRRLRVWFVLLLCLALFALIDEPTTWLMLLLGAEANDAVEAGYRGLIGLVAVVGGIAVWLAWRSARRERDKPDNPLVRQLNDDQISSILTSVHAQGDFSKQLQIYMSLLFSGDELEHAHETYTVHREVTRRSVTKRFAKLPEINKKLRTDSFPVPIATLRKGYLPNNLHIVARDGTSLPSVGYGRVLALQLNVLEALIHGAFGDMNARLETAPETEAGAPPVEFKQVVQEARRHIARYGISVPNNSGEFDVEATIQRLERFPLNGPNEDEGFSQLEDFLRLYTDAYPLVSDVPRSLLQHPFEIRFSEDVPLTASLENWSDRLRMRLGLGSYKFSFPLFMHELSESYHLVVEAAPTTYLFSQQIRDETGRTLASKEVCERAEQGRESWEPYTYLRLRHRHGLPYSHLYARGFERFPSRQGALNLQVRFHERPPGALGAATLLAGSLVAVIASIGWVMSGEGPIGPPTDLPALLLVLPGVVALLFGQDMRSTTLVTASLTARVGFFSTLLLSLLAILLYVGQATKKVDLPVLELSVLGVPLPITDVGWLALSTSSLLIFWYLFFTFCLRTVTYEHRSVTAERTGHREKLGATAP